MQINPNHVSRIIEVWLTKADAADPCIQAQLHKLYQQYNGSGYWVVVYQSGHDPLYDTMRDLLRCNKSRMP